MIVRALDAPCVRISRVDLVVRTSRASPASRFPSPQVVCETKRTDLRCRSSPLRSPPRCARAELTASHPRSLSEASEPARIVSALRLPLVIAHACPHARPRPSEQRGRRAQTVRGGGRASRSAIDLASLDIAVLARDPRLVRGRTCDTPREQPLVQREPIRALWAGGCRTRTRCMLARAHCASLDSRIV